jgi:hypothetical protein
MRRNREILTGASLLAAVGMTIMLAGCSSSGDPSHNGVGTVILGRIENATVEVYERQSDGTFTLLFTTTTEQTDVFDAAGTFDPQAHRLSSNRMYLFKAIGGQDVDADDDGVRDAVPTPVQGVMHALMRGNRARSDFRMTLLSELVYQRVRWMLEARYDAAAIWAAMDKYAATLLTVDSNLDSRIDREDMFVWEPVQGKNDLSRGWAEFSKSITAVHANDVDTLWSEAYRLADAVVGRVEPTHRAVHVTISGNYAFVSNRQGGIQIVDISDPTGPNEITVVSVNEKSNGTAVAGNYLYVAGQGDFQVFDITNINSPVEKDSISMDNCQKVAVLGDYAYVADRGEGVKIVNISDPDNLVMQPGEDTAGEAQDVFIYASNLFVAENEWVEIPTSRSSRTSPWRARMPEACSWKATTSTWRPTATGYRSSTSRPSPLPTLSEELIRTPTVTGSWWRTAWPTSRTKLWGSMSST